MIYIPVTIILVLCSRVAEDGEHADDENKGQSVTLSSNLDVMCKQVDENLAIAQELKLPVVAPALKNLGMLLGLASII